MGFTPKDHTIPVNHWGSCDLVHGIPWSRTGTSNFQYVASLLTQFLQYIDWVDNLQLPKQWCGYLMTQTDAPLAQPLTHDALIETLKTYDHTTLRELAWYLVDVTNTRKSGQLGGDSSRKPKAKGFKSARTMEKTGTSRNIIYL